MRLLLCRSLLLLCMIIITSIQTAEVTLPIIHRASKKDWHDFLGLA